MTGSDRLSNRTGKFSSIFMFIVMLAYTMMFLDTTTWYQMTHNIICASVKLASEYAALLLSLISIIRETVIIRKAKVIRHYGWKYYALLISRAAVVILGSMIILVSRESFETWVMIAIAIASGCIDEKKILRYAFIIGCVIVIVVFFLSMAGLIENNRGDAFGFIYRTHYACHLMCLALTFCLMKDGRITYINELVIIVLAVLEIVFVKGKTCFICVALLMAGTMWRHYRQCRLEDLKDSCGKLFEIAVRIVYIPVILMDRLVTVCRLQKHKRAAVKLAVYSFIICAVFFLLLTLYCRQLLPVLELIPGLGTAKMRLFLGRAAFDVFNVHLLGNMIPQWGLSGSEGSVDLYFAIDSGYIKLLLEYGLIPFVLVIGLMTRAQLRLYRAKRYYAVFILAIFALDGLMDYWIINMGYNIFILLTTCSLQTADELDQSKEEQRQHAAMPGRRSIIAAVLCCAFLTVWCITAYPISTWRGWTPVKGATVVLPGAYVDGIGSEALLSERIEITADYLMTHSDAETVICSNDAEDLKKRLVRLGVDGKRIHIDTESESVDAMLESSRDMIREQKLPPRMTICAYAMQQERIRRHARKMGIALNSLTPEMPLYLYMPNFTIEQWRVLL